MSEKKSGQYVKLDKPRKIVKSHNFSKFYTKHSKFKASCSKYNIIKEGQGKLNREALWRLAGRFFEKVGDHMINNKSGVFLKGLGYFVPFLFIEPRKSKAIYRHLKIREDNYYYETDGHFYFLDFYPMKRSKSPLGAFSLEGYVNKNLKEKFKKRLKEGYRYKLKYTLLKQFYG